MLINPVRRFSWRVIFWLIPAFALWWYSLTPVILNGYAIPISSILEQQFQREQLQFSHDQQGRWLIDTRVTLKPKQANDKRSFSMSAQLTGLINFTLALPLLWALFIATPCPWRRKLKNLALANAVLWLTVGFNLWLQAFVQIQTLLAGSDIDRIFVSPGIYLAVEAYSQQSLEILKFSNNILNYCNLILLPVILWYGLHKDWIMQHWSRDLPKP